MKNYTDTEELKPCPFCGAVLRSKQEVWRYRGLNRTVPVYAHPNTGCTLDYKRIHAYIDEEVEKWNRRVNDGMS